MGGWGGGAENKFLRKLLLILLNQNYKADQNTYGTGDKNYYNKEKAPPSSVDINNSQVVDFLGGGRGSQI